MISQSYINERAIAGLLTTRNNNGNFKNQSKIQFGNEPIVERQELVKEKGLKVTAQKNKSRGINAVFNPNEEDYD